MRENLEKRLLLGFGVVLTIAIFVVIAAVRNTFRSIAGSEWVDQTHAVVTEVEGILAALNNAEAIQRTYLMSGSEPDRQAYRIAAADVAEHLGVAKVLTQYNSRQSNRLATLEKQVNPRLELLDAVIKTRLEKGYDVARTELLATSSQQGLAEIRKDVSDLKQEENVLLHERDQEANASARGTRYILFVGLGLNFLLLAFLFLLIQADLAVRRRAAVALREYNERLEDKVKERTAELTRSNQSLEIENLERRWMAEAAERQYLYNELVIQCIDAGVYVITRNGSITLLNLAGGRMAGCEPEALVGKSIATILPLDDTEKSWKESRLYQTITRDESLHNVGASLRRKDGSFLNVHFNSRPMRAEGKVVGAVVTVFGPVAEL